MPFEAIASQRPREPRPGRRPRGRDAQPIDPRSAARPDRAGVERDSGTPSSRGRRAASPATPTATSASTMSTGSPTDVRPDDWVVVDCIEFDERFRHADPIADIAFLAMELTLEGRDRTWPARSSRSISAPRTTRRAAELLPFYRAYRAAVRGKVEGHEAGGARDPRGRPRRRPGSGPGPSGSSPSPSWRSPAAGRAWCWWPDCPAPANPPWREAWPSGPGSPSSARTMVRKELAGRGGQAATPAAFGQDIYTPEWDERTYAECLRRAEEIVFEAGRVLVDASFREESRRRLFLDAARRWGVAGRMLLCRADPDVVRRRLDRSPRRRLGCRLGDLPGGRPPLGGARRSDSRGHPRNRCRWHTRADARPGPGRAAAGRADR